MPLDTLQVDAGVPAPLILVPLFWVLLVTLYVPWLIGRFGVAWPSTSLFKSSVYDSFWMHNLFLYDVYILYLSDRRSRHAAQSCLPAVGPMMQLSRPLSAVFSMGHMCTWRDRLKIWWIYQGSVYEHIYIFLGIYRRGKGPVARWVGWPEEWGTTVHG